MAMTLMTPCKAKAVLPLAEVTPSPISSNKRQAAVDSSSVQAVAAVGMEASHSTSLVAAVEPDARISLLVPRRCHGFVFAIHCIINYCMFWEVHSSYYNEANDCGS
jgi:hypothetical protein